MVPRRRPGEKGSGGLSSRLRAGWDRQGPVTGEASRFRGVGPVPSSLRGGRDQDPLLGHGRIATDFGTVSDQGDPTV